MASVRCDCCAGTGRCVASSPHLATCKEYPPVRHMDSFEIRRVYLRCGGNSSAAARVLSTTRQNVEQHVARANRLSPLTHGKGSPEDRAAVAVYQRMTLDRVGILHG